MCSATDVGEAVCRRCGGGVDIVTWAYQDEGRYSCRTSGIRTDSVEQEGRCHAPEARSQHIAERVSNLG